MKLILKALVITTIAWHCAAAAATIKVENLRCEGMENPLSIDAAHPQLSWIIQSDERGQKQTACQVLVASSLEKLARGEGDLWDSGRLATEQSVWVPYAGKLLASRAQCYWKVRVWDAQNKPTEWSAPARWSMGLLAPEDWKANWISASKWHAPNGNGWNSLGFETEDSPAWVRVDLGRSQPIDKVKLVALNSASFPLRFRIEAGDDFDFATSKIVADCSQADYVLKPDGTAEFPASGVKARYVRFYLLKSPPTARKGNTSGKGKDKAGKKASGNGEKYQSGFRQLEVWSGGKNVARYCPITETGGSHCQFVVDGMPSVEMGKNCPEDACPKEQAPMLRKAFTLEHPVKRAVLYYAAQGMADLSINGSKVDDTLLGPPFTDYSKRIMYCTVEVTSLVSGGPNVLGAVLGNGFFSPPGHGHAAKFGSHGQPCLLAQLEVEFTDGTRQLIVSDPSWKWSRSEIVNNDLWNGYEEDRNFAQPGWDKPGFDDKPWRAVGLAESLGGKLCSPIEPPVRVLGQLKPIRVEGDTAAFDVYSAGWPRLSLEHGKAGQVIEFNGERMVKCSFTLAKDGPAVLEPRFIWGSGPLKVQVKGLTEPLRAEQICIQRVGLDMRPMGSFHCSNPFLNELHEGVLRTHRNYVLDIPMDPMREKKGWTQDIQGFFNSAFYLTDVESDYRKWWRDIADTQLPNGLVSVVAPLVREYSQDWNSPWWSGVVVWLPWEHYLYYGDRRLLEEAYEPMRKYVNFLDRLASAGGGTKALGYLPDFELNLDAEAAKERMLVMSGAGDWMRPSDAPPKQLLPMSGFYHYAKIVSQTAAMLGKTEDAAKYAAMAEDIRQRTNAKFLNPKTGLYAESRKGHSEENAKSQSSQVMPLATGLVPEAVRPLAYQRLIDAIHAHNDHHACGFVSLTYLFQTLIESYESGLLNRIVNQSDYPCWKTLMHDGVLFETWKGGAAQMPSCGGAVGRWFYEGVLGIRPDPAGPGFKRFILAPQPDPATGLTEAEGWYDSLYGRINSKWKIAGDTFELKATIPVNTVATVRIPTSNPDSVLEGKRPVKESAGVKVLRQEPGALSLEVGAGQYHFNALASASK